MIAFVTGGTGFVGLNLIEELTRLGWDVVALHRRSSDLTYIRRFPVHLVEGSVEDLASVERAMPKEVDAVFHVAGDTNLWFRNNDRQTLTNVLGTRHVVAAAQASGAKRFVHTSTQSVYGFVVGRTDETAPHLGRDSWFNYMRTKALAEDEVREGIAHGLDAVIMNPTRVIGRYDQHNWARLVLLAAEGKLLRLPPGKGSYCHSVEVARAHIAAVTRGRTGENYLLGGADATFKEALDIVGELIGKRIARGVFRVPVLRGASRVFEFASRITGKEPFLTPEMATLLTSNESFVSDKATRELGYRQVPLREILQDFCDWLAGEGLLKLAPR